ncbi:MAG TPA: tyrosine-type recombinase/integrase [Micropepsaceae bacterium]|nr:tyrosine-type recombinase/integrase [Micropepsaceae bacterium]
MYTRPAEYRAVARLEIKPAGVVAEATDDTKSPGLQSDPKSFLTEVQVLTSRPLLEEVVKRLGREGKLPKLGQDPVDAVQRMLRPEPVEGTQVVQLFAEGTQQALVSDLVNGVAAVYRERVSDSFKERTASTSADVGDEAQNLHKQVEEKQRALDVFRERYDIVSLNRNENDVLAKIEGLNRTYSEANEQVAKTEGRLQALKQSAAEGKNVVRAKDDPTLADIEQRISALREQRRELERRFTPAYLALDTDATSMLSRIADLEQQLKDRRAASQQGALVEAQDELSTAQATVARLRKDIDENQKGAREFAARLAQFKVMQDDLDHLQGMERAVLDRSTKLQSSVRERAPRVELLEAAAPSLAPWRPDYSRDAVISVAGSLVFGLLATLLGEFLHGPAPARSMLVHHSLALPSMERYAAPALRTINTPSPAQLAPPEPPPRELEHTELAALIGAASEDLRLAAVALLMGLSPEEIVALRWDEVDLAVGAIDIGGAFARTIPLQEPLTTLLEQCRRGAAGSAPVLHNDRGDPLRVDDLNRLVLYGAYDAGLDRPSEVTAGALRHAYLAFLLRQGIRASDIARIAGHVPEAELTAHMQQTSARPRLPLEQIDPVHPVLRKLADGLNG